jgi:uncharacterized membrane protein YphA (DoxX/SURF4 family)
MKENSLFILQMLTSTMLALLFLQSGLDKVFNWGGNLDWLKVHFAKSVLKDVVPFLLAVLTVFEVIAGGFSLFGTVNLFLSKNTDWAFLGAVLSAICVVMLFFGQRMAQDYAGAASLANYFLLCVAAIYFLSK